MGAAYHVWYTDELCALIPHEYRDIWEVYKNARYPTMRVDIGRFAFLHKYGGLYAVLETFPIRPSYEQALLSVGCVRWPAATKPQTTRPTAKVGTMRRPNVGSGPGTRRAEKTKVERIFEMEVRVAAKGNPA